MIASRSAGYSRYSHTNSKRSMFHGLTRVGDLRRRTTSCWRRRRFSASSRARLVNRDRNSKQQLGQKRHHSAASLPYAHPRVIPDEVFREAHHMLGEVHPTDHQGDQRKPA